MLKVLKTVFASIYTTIGLNGINIAATVPQYPQTLFPSFENVTIETYISVINSINTKTVLIMVYRNEVISKKSKELKYFAFLAGVAGYTALLDFLTAAAGSKKSSLLVTSQSTKADAPLWLLRRTYGSHPETHNKNI